jgi:predicted dehydrogenase
MNPIGIGVIGLGESGQHHISVIQGERTQSAVAAPPEKLSLMERGRRTARKLLRGDTPAPPRPLTPGIGDLKLVGVADVDEARLAATAQDYGIPHPTTDYKKLLDRNDIDAVLICTPPTFHPQITLEAAQR